MFKPEWHDEVAGRQGSDWAPPKGTIGKFIDNILPGGHTTAVNHDKLVDVLVRSGVPDLLANFPTMIPTYVFSLGQELVNSFVGGINAVSGAAFSRPFMHVDPGRIPRRTGDGRL